MDLKNINISQKAQERKKKLKRLSEQLKRNIKKRKINKNIKLK